MMPKQRIGFIGLGLMGKPMALNILKHGFELSVYNRTKPKTRELERKGAFVFDTPRELASNSDVIITMVTGPNDVKEVLFGRNGAVQGAREGTTVIDMSTIGPSAAKEISKKLSGYNINFLDAPVTCSVPAAESGSLTIFAGGKFSTYKKYRNILKCMGQNVNYAGNTGSGQAIKLVNNLLIGINAEAIAEAIILGEAEGIPREKTAKLLENSPIISPFIRIKMKNIIKNDYNKLFSVSNISKDLKLAIIESKTSNLPILKNTSELFYNAAKNHSEEDLLKIVGLIPRTLVRQFSIPQIRLYL